MSFSCTESKGWPPHCKRLAERWIILPIASSASTELRWTASNRWRSFYVKHLKAKQPQGPYHIVGYSYGANVAYEMAHQLQEASSENTIGSLILLDASHLYWKAYGDLYRKTYQVEAEDISNDAQFETELLCAIIIRYASITYQTFREELMQLDSWKSRLNYALDTLIESNSNLQENRENLHNALDALVLKFQAADKYRPVEKKRKFKGNVTLIRAENGALKIDEYGEDYGLAQIVTGRVDILVVPGDHTTCVQGTSGAQVAALINKKIPKT